MQWMDIFILSVIGISSILGLFRGLVREVVSLGGWVVAGWVAFKFAGPVGEQFGMMISIPSLRMGVAFVTLLVGILMLFGIFNFLLGKLIDSTGLTGTDRMLGVLFGVARGVAIVALLVILAGLTPLPKDPWWRESLFIGHLEALAKLGVSWLPEKFAKHFDYSPSASLRPYMPSPTGVGGSSS
ncbi:MAG: CvpA family protein [Gammaproteobacteria bacterium]|nr:CvpA family protein [Gammaproteobacteria bacterium]